ncbi:MAG: murein L,D-transpeptidase YcbB/YkuD [Paracoccaceae bacterium]|jgi:murein L,D-transpeptidase YcbB/YkuD
MTGASLMSFLANRRWTLSAAAVALTCAVVPLAAQTVVPTPPPAVMGVAAVLPQARAIRGAVESIGDPALLAVYAGRNWAPIWLGDRPGRVAASMLAAFEGAGSHGLPSVADTAALRVRLDALAGLTGTAAWAEQAALDVALSLAAMRYGTELTSGALSPRRIDDEIHIDPPRPDRMALLNALAASAEPRRTLEAMAPADPGYAALRGRLAAFRALIESGGWAAPAPDARVLRLGDSGPQVERLRVRLIELGDASPDLRPVVVASNAVEPPAAPSFDAELEAAVIRFQTRHGLNADGLVGRRSLEAMSVTAAGRLRQIAVNLERMRWMNRDLGARRIEVNQADFTMTLFDKGTQIETMRVVVGKADKHRTPEFSDVMTHMVVNPSWNIPRSITTKEILPLLRADPSYLARQNMVLIPTGDDPAPDPYTVDWSSYSERSFPWRIKQLPGDGNALGRVKFMFPNQFSIYLHDTPSRSLFAKDMRAFSHGCVRLERPIDLAHLLLEGQVDDPVVQFEEWEARGEEIWVKIENPLQVHLMYRTAWVDTATGQDRFRADIYGRDATVWAALEKAGVSAM